MSRGNVLVDRSGGGEENGLAQFLAGLEARLSRQLTADRDTIVDAISGGGALSAGGAATAGRAASLAARGGSPRARS